MREILPGGFPPRISIIIPVHNTEPFLKSCLDSILNQSYTDYEVILIENGSMDRSAAICKEYCSAHANFHLIQMPDSGVSPARNAGIEAAQGEFITFADSDDWVEPGWLQSYMDVQADRPDCDLWVQGIIVNGNDGAQRDETLPQAFCEGDALPAAILLLERRSMSGYVWNKLYRTSILKTHGLTFDDFILREDQLFNIKYYCLIRSLEIIPKACYHYRLHRRESLSKKKYPALYMLRLANALREAKQQAADRFGDQAFDRFTWETYFDSYVMIVGSMYLKPRNIYTRAERMEIIRGYHKQRRLRPDIRLHYRDKKKWLLEKIVALPPALCDPITSVVLKFTNQSR